MAVTNLINFDQIRSVLTVSKSDLPDSVLQSYSLGDDLLIELMSWFPDFESNVDELVAAKLRKFSKLFCAATLATTAPVFVLSRITSGDNTTERGSSDSLLYLRDSLLSQANSVKLDIMSSIGLGSGSEDIVMVSVNKPYRDVITEARK